MTQPCLFLAAASRTAAGPALQQSEGSMVMRVHPPSVVLGIGVGAGLAWVLQQLLVWARSSALQPPGAHSSSSEPLLATVITRVDEIRDQMQRGLAFLDLLESNRRSKHLPASENNEPEGEEDDPPFMDASDRFVNIECARPCDNNPGSTASTTEMDFFREIDALTEQCEGLRAAHVLQEKSLGFRETSELLWRVARGHYHMASACPNKEEKIAIIRKAVSLGKRAIELNENCSFSHKWCRCLFRARSALNCSAHFCWCSQVCHRHWRAFTGVKYQRENRVWLYLPSPCSAGH